MAFSFVLGANVTTFAENSSENSVIVTNCEELKIALLGYAKSTKDCYITITKDFEITSPLMTGTNDDGYILFIDGGNNTLTVNTNKTAFTANYGSWLQIHNLYLVGGDKAPVSVFEIERASNIYFDNVNITGITTQNGVIENYGQLNIGKSAITGNTSMLKSGGINNYNLIKLNQVEISNNTGVDGGGICTTTYGTGYLNTTTMSGNKASGNGGAIYNEGLIILDGKLTDNHSDKDGGAIYNKGNASVKATITGNSSAGDGGAIYNAKSIVVEGTVSNNEAVGNGGGIYDRNLISLEVQNCTLNGNNATGNGGAIYFGKKPGKFSGELILKTISMENNKELVVVGKGNANNVSADPELIFTTDCKDEKIKKSMKNWKRPPQ